MKAPNTAREEDGRRNATKDLLTAFGNNKRYEEKKKTLLERKKKHEEQEKLR